MKILQSSDYRIYIDDVRVDPYVKTWTAACGLRASDASATITLYRTKKLEQWKGYLAQVRIFTRNVFSGKFGIVFEGEIVNRNWGDQRYDVGEIVFTCKGFYHWLDIPIPLLIGEDDTYSFVKRFQFEAQNMDVEGIRKFWLSREDQLMKDLTLEQIISQLFELINSGYYNYDDSTFSWTKLGDRFKVMGDIITEFRSAGYLDAFTWTRSTQIDSFYVYLNEILTQMMFEFYQDRDGAIRIKNPSWKDNILKAHIIDESVIQNVSGFNDWSNEPTRVLVIGGESDVTKYSSKQVGSDGILTIPMGLYIGKPGEGEYFSQNVELLLKATGDDTDYSDPAPSSDGTVQLSWKADPKKASAVGRGAGYGGMMYYVEAAYNDVKDRFGKTNFMGGYANRNVVGGSSKSMHAFGRAFDIGSTSAIMSKIAEYAKGFPNVQYVIYNRRICGPGGGEWRTYNGANPHTDHVHVDFLPVDGPSSKTSTGGGKEDSGTSGTGNLANYMNQDLLKPAKIPSAETINKIIKHGVDLRGGKSKLLNQGAAFVQAANESGMNPLFMLALAGWESGWGTNTISKTKNNFFSIGAIDSNPTGGAYRYDTPASAIVSAAKWIRKNWYDRGQTTIWKMNHSKSGTHNWASDNNWVNGVAGVWKGFGNVANDGTSISTTSPTSSTTSTSTSPNAAVGGVSITTRYAPTTPTALRPSQVTPKAIPVDYHSFNVDIVKYPIPTVANTYRTSITGRTNGVNGNLICFIIETASSWREKYKSNKHYGLMGIPKNYIDLVLGGKTSKMYVPEDNIFHGTKQFQNGYVRYSNKVTFGLASLYLGDISLLEGPIKSAGVEDFSKVRNYLGADVVKFVDTVINNFCKFFGGTYIKGDPHFTIAPDKPGGSNADDPVPGEYESSYKPIMSDEERLYKVNLKISEQLLIRYDSAAMPANAMGADELVQRYAKYMMQLYRAESHGVAVSLSTCMPFIRPGWNAWLEPTRRNVVFYVTGVTHQGSYGTGAFSTVTGGFVRDPGTYDDIEDNIFVGQTKVTAADFGEVIKKSEMNDLKKQLSALHNQSDEVIGDARKIPTLSKMYSSAVGSVTDFTTMWNNEFTSSEIDTKIKTLYKSAPNVVKTRSSTFKSIIDDAAAFYKKVLLSTTY
jgi:hypothetical protein